MSLLTLIPVIGIAVPPLVMGKQTPEWLSVLSFLMYAGFFIFGMGYCLVTLVQIIAWMLRNKRLTAPARRTPEN